MASEEDVLLREVDEDLSRDQTFRMFRKYRVPLAVGAVAIIAGVAGYQVITAQREAAAAEAAQRYAEISFLAETAVPTSELTGFADTTDTGFSVLASFRAAADLAREGDLEGARDLYARIYGDRSVSPAMRDVARIRAAHALFDNRTGEAAEIAGLVETEAFRPFAEEIASAAALKEGQYAAAKAGFTALAGSPAAPESVRARADNYAAIAEAALAGADIAPPRGEVDIQSFIEQFGAQLDAAGAPVVSPDDAASPLSVLEDLTDGNAPAAAGPSEDDAGEAPQ